MLTSCAVGPNFQVPTPPEVESYLPGRSGSADAVAGRSMLKGADIPPQWWELFRAPSLNQLVRDAIAYNAELSAAEAAVRVAQANALAQRGSLFPSVTGNLNSSRERTANVISPDVTTGNNPFTLHTAQVSVSYILDIWGGTRRQIESLDALAEVKAFEREGIYLTLTSSVALAAIEEARLVGQIAVTQRLIDLQTQLLTILRRQYEQGQIGQPDVSSQEAVATRALLLLPPLQRDLAKQRNLLATLTGRFPSERVRAAFRLTSFQVPHRLPLSLPADLVRQRPDIRAAEATLRSANAEIGVAIANRLPQITLSANRGSTAEQLSQLFNPGSGMWQLASNIVQPIFDAGTLMHKQRAAEEATNEAVAKYRKVVMEAFQNVADVLLALQADAKSITAAIRAEQAAQQNVSLVRKQVEAGQVNIPLLIEAQRSLLEASTARVDAEASRLSNTVALFQALGGGWWNNPFPAERAAIVAVSR